MYLSVNSFLKAYRGKVPGLEASQWNKLMDGSETFLPPDGITVNRTVISPQKWENIKWNLKPVWRRRLKLDLKLTYVLKGFCHLIANMFLGVCIQPLWSVKGMPSSHSSITSCFGLVISDKVRHSDPGEEMGLYLKECVCGFHDKNKVCGLKEQRVSAGNWGRNRKWGKLTMHRRRGA